MTQKKVSEIRVFFLHLYTLFFKKIPSSATPEKTLYSDQHQHQHLQQKHTHPHPRIQIRIHYFLTLSPITHHVAEQYICNAGTRNN